MLLVGSHVDSAGLLRTLQHCWPPAQALPGHCSLLIGPLLLSRPLIGPWPSSAVHTVLRSLLPGPGTQGWVLREGPALSSGQPGLDTQLRDNNLAEWLNAHNFSINWSSEPYTQGSLPCNISLSTPYLISHLKKYKAKFYDNLSDVDIICHVLGQNSDQLVKIFRSKVASRQYGALSRQYGAVSRQKHQIKKYGILP